MEVPTITLWEGIPLENMTKEELIAALNQLGEMHLAALESHSRSLRIWEACQKARQS